MIFIFLEIFFSMKSSKLLKSNLRYKSLDDFYSNVQKITSTENLRSRAFDEIVPFRVVSYLAIELNINCNRKIAEVIFLTLLI